MPDPPQYSGRALCAAVIVLVILVVIVFVGAGVRRYENYLAGLWVGDAAFLEKAQLRDFQLFIAPREGGRRQGYLIITGESGEFVSNQAIEIRERSAASRWWSALRSSLRAEKDAYTARHFEVEYDAVEEGEAPPMPEKMRMTLSILDGTLTLYDGEKVYAFMEKDPVASAAAVESYSA